MTPSVEGSTRQAGDRKEGDMRQAGGVERLGGDGGERLDKMQAKRQAGDTYIRGVKEVAESCATNLITTSESVMRRQVIERRG